MQPVLPPRPVDALTLPRSFAMLPPGRAWRLLCQRTGATVCRATFYRWLSNGKLYSVRVGFRIYVPTVALEQLIDQCLTGEGLFHRQRKEVGRRRVSRRALTDWPRGDIPTGGTIAQSRAGT